MSENLPVATAVDYTPNENVQRAIITNNNITPTADLNLNIKNKLGLCSGGLFCLNIIYLFMSIYYFFLRLGLIVVCHYYGIEKENLYFLNAYMRGLYFDILVGKAILIFLWIKKGYMFLICFELFQIIFEYKKILCVFEYKRYIQERAQLNNPIDAQIVIL